MKVHTLASFVTIILPYGLPVTLMINCMYILCLFTHIDGVHATWSMFVIWSKKWKVEAGFPNPIFPWYRRGYSAKLSGKGTYFLYFKFKFCVSVYHSISQMKHQLDATLCRFYFCRVTLHVSGASARNISLLGPELRSRP